MKSYSALTMNTLSPTAHEAIILRRLPYGEADLIVTFLSASAGKLKGIARHAKRSQKRFSGCLEPGTQVEITAQARPGSELMVIHEARQREWPALREFPQMAALGVALEVVDHCWPLQQASPEKFQLVAAFLEKLAESPAPVPTLVSFLGAFLKLAGFLANWEASSSLGDAGLDAHKEWVDHALTWPLAAPVPAAVYAPLLRFLENYISHLVEKPLKSSAYWPLLAEAL